MSCRRSQLKVLMTTYLPLQVMRAIGEQDNNAVNKTSSKIVIL